MVRDAKQGDMKTSMWEYFRKNAGWYVAGLIAALLVVAGFFVWRFWEWLRIVPQGYESARRQFAILDSS